MQYFQCALSSMSSDGSDIVESLSRCPLFSCYLLYPHTSIYKKIVTPYEGRSVGSKSGSSFKLSASVSSRLSYPSSNPFCALFPVATAKCMHDFLCVLAPHQYEQVLWRKCLELETWGCLYDMGEPYTLTVQPSPFLEVYVNPQLTLFCHPIS